MLETPPSEPVSPWTRHRDELFVALQRMTPHHSLSRLVAGLAESRRPWLRNALIGMAMKRYRIDLSDALVEEPSDYRTFNEFFTRRLKPDARPVDDNPLSLTAPADGVISQAGAIRDGQLIQAKGKYFSVDSLLGFDREICDRFRHGAFTTIYLAPGDYHRVHMPVAGTLQKTRYVPGSLFSVNTATAAGIDNLFTRNERLNCLFDTPQGPVAVVLVGAMLVAGIETVWQQNFTPGHLEERSFADELLLAKGDELGLFKFGSTVVVLTAGDVAWRDGLTSGRERCRVGEPLGVFNA